MAGVIQTLTISEDEEQATVFEYMARRRLAPGVMLIDRAYMNPNGLYLGSGKNRFAVIAKAKRMGFKTGVPDITIRWPWFGLHGAYLEMKRIPKVQKPTRKTLLAELSEEQGQFLTSAYHDGYFAAVCFGAGQAIDAIELYLSGGGRGFNLGLFIEGRENDIVLPGRQPMSTPIK